MRDSQWLSWATRPRKIGERREGRSLAWLGMTHHGAMLAPNPDSLKLSAGRLRRVTHNMSAIIIEGVLFVALIAALVTLAFFVFMHFTPAGIRVRQTQNRRRIDRAA